MESSYQLATFGGGCFWCIDAAFRRVNGIRSVTSGYAGGALADPSYQEICSGMTGHAEVVQLDFDPRVIDYPTLLKMFFALHDPTQLNRQGNDKGTQYRSVVFYHNEAQRQQTQTMLEQLAPEYDCPLVTELSPATTFYPAEGYHQDYYNENPNQGYCSLLIAPKLAKFSEQFHSRLKQ